MSERLKPQADCHFTNLIFTLRHDAPRSPHVCVREVLDEPKRLCGEQNENSTQSSQTPNKPLWTTDKGTDTKVSNQRTDTKTCLWFAGTAAASLTGGIRSVMPFCAVTLNWRIRSNDATLRGAMLGSTTAVQAPTPWKTKASNLICRGLTIPDWVDRHFAASLTGSYFRNTERPP